MINEKESKLKDILIIEIQKTALLVQSLDQVYISELNKNRSNYTNEDVYLNVLNVVLTASSGVGLIKTFYKYCNISQEELNYIEKLMGGYNKLKRDLLAIYREHSKNTEEIY